MFNTLFIITAAKAAPKTTAAALGASLETILAVTVFGIIVSYGVAVLMKALFVGVRHLGRKSGTQP
jgi:hypothetical protein